MIQKDLAMVHGTESIDPARLDELLEKACAELGVTDYVSNEAFTKKFKMTGEFAKMQDTKKTEDKSPDKSDLFGGLKTGPIFNKKKDDDNFLNYGNSNSKNLYLLLFEDL